MNEFLISIVTQLLVDFTASNIMGVANLCFFCYYAFIIFGAAQEKSGTISSTLAKNINAFIDKCVVLMAILSGILWFVVSYLSSCVLTWLLIYNITESTSGVHIQTLILSYCVSAHLTITINNFITIFARLNLNMRNILLLLAITICPVAIIGLGYVSYYIAGL